MLTQELEKAIREKGELILSKKYYDEEYTQYSFQTTINLTLNIADDFNALNDISKFDNKNGEFFDETTKLMIIRYPQLSLSLGAGFNNKDVTIEFLVMGRN